MEKETASSAAANIIYELILIEGSNSVGEVDVFKLGGVQVLGWRVQRQ